MTKFGGQLSSTADDRAKKRKTIEEEKNKKDKEHFSKMSKNENVDPYGQTLYIKSQKNEPVKDAHGNLFLLTEYNPDNKYLSKYINYNLINRQKKNDVKDYYLNIDNNINKFYYKKDDVNIDVKKYLNPSVIEKVKGMFGTNKPTEGGKSRSTRRIKSKKRKSNMRANKKTKMKKRKTKQRKTRRRRR
jgi:hypothetical protein